jgi:hypothetical protein
VRKVMKRGGLTAELGEACFFFDVHEAVEAARRAAPSVGEPPRPRSVDATSAVHEPRGDFAPAT